MTLGHEHERPSEEELRDLVALCLERAEQEGSAGIEAVCDAHPRHAARIRAALLQLRAAGLVAAGDVAGEVPAQVGEYRLVRKLGEGGMGVVYLAEQTRLSRHVALKLMRTDLPWVGGAKERLLREVEAVGRLNHPGIVSVFDVGEHAGQPFFSMEFVAGMTVADVITTFRGRDPGALRGVDLRQAVCAHAGADASIAEGEDLFAGSWAQAALRVVQRVARALAHAHGRGIVHRDVKPSNVMVTADGRVVLLDFGLAQVPGSPKITRTGSALGSLAYMSPEQVGRSPVDARTDVYSLGVTLYELLTLRSAFAEGDITGLEWRILQGGAPAPRSVARSTPIDADTVCSKAMARHLADRYQTMTAFADDLGNVLELRPVHARRPSLSRRALRLAQRNAATSAALAALVVLAVGVPALWFWQENRAEARITAIEVEQARGFLEQMHARIQDGRLAALPGGSDLREEMARDVLEQFERTRALQPHDLELAREGLVLLAEYGRLFEELNAQDDAARAYARCIDLAQGMATTTLADDTQVATAWTGRVSAAQSLARIDEARALAAQALAFHERARARHGDARPLVLGRAAVHFLLAKMAHETRELPERDARMAEAIALVERFAEAAGDHEAQSVQGYYLAERAGFANAARDFETAAKDFERAMLRHRAAVQARPDEEHLIGRMAKTVMAYSVVLSMLGERERGERLLESACADLEEIVARFPQHGSYRSTLGGLLNNLAQVRLAQGQHEEAIDLLERAIGYQESYLARNPHNVYARRFLANHRVLLAFVRVARGEHLGLDDEVGAFPDLKGVLDGHVLASELSARRLEAARGDPELEDEERSALLADYEQQALFHLRGAVDAGLLEVSHFDKRVFAALADQGALFTLRQMVAERRRNER